MAGTQSYEPDPRNDDVLVYVNGELTPRSQAVVSIFDAGFVLGDGVWESFRLHRGRLLFLREHLDRLEHGARAIDLDIGLSREALADAIRRTIDANGMTDGVHIRLMVTRGRKSTPNQDPRFCIGSATIVIVPEWKQVSTAASDRSVSLFTSSIRCPRKDMFDMKLNTHSRLLLITALNQAIKAGADEALMLDADGFVASCNSVNFFFVTGGEVCTSTGENCFNGITRGVVIDLCRQHGLPIRQGNFGVNDVYSADEAFVTGTLGGLAPVREVDGRRLPHNPGPMTEELTQLYRRLLDQEAAGAADALPAGEIA